MSRQHLNILVVMVLLAIPLFVLDMFLLKSRGGGWISLNLRGMLVGPYIAFVLVHAVLSSIAVRVYAGAGLGTVHTLSALLSIALLVAGVLTYSRIDHALSAKRHEQRSEELRALGRVIELREWWYEPDAQAPVAVHVRVRVNESGRFAGNLDASGADGMQVFSSHDTAQRQVERGEEFVHVFPLRFWQEQRTGSVTIALYLFKDRAGSAPEDVSMIWLDEPPGETDGHFIYAKLPPPRAAP